MKDSIMGRIIYYIFMIIVLLISICLFMFSIGVVSFDHVQPYLELYYTGNWVVNAITALVATFLFIASVKLVSPSKGSKRLTGALVKNTELGEIQVSVGTLNNLAQKAVRKFDEVKDVDSNISPEIDGIAIQLKIMIMPDVIIPELTKQLQDEVKIYIEKISGIHVKEVQIFIDNLTHPQMPRVE